MRTVIWILIAASALGFALAVIGSLVGWVLFGVTSEGFSRACSNLALIAIALLLAWHKKSA
jgi:hypothetical protein